MDELLFDGNTAIEAILDDAASELELAATDVIEYDSTDIDDVAEIEDDDVGPLEDDEDLKEEIDYLTNTESYDDDVITYPVYSDDLGEEDEDDDEDDEYNSETDDEELDNYLY